MAANDLIDPQQSVLVLVDYQRRLMPAIEGGAEVLARALQLADIARELGVRVVGTEQNPRGLGENDGGVRARCEATLSKMHFGACADGLLEWVGSASRHVVVAGCEAHVCLLQTALGLLQAGHRVWVVADASGSRSASNHALAMARLGAAGATIVSVEMVAFEWLRSCDGERFKRVLPLLKNTTRR